MENFSIVHCNLDTHGQAILEILNAAIENSTALYDYKSRTPESMTEWFAVKQSGNFPVIGLENEAGTLLGFGTFGTFRNWPAFKYSAEHSIYIHQDFRRQGLATILLGELVKAAKSRNLHSLIGGIDATNEASISFHQKHGFQHVGTIPEVGFKFGKWLDLAFYQLILETPTSPKDG